MRISDAMRILKANGLVELPDQPYVYLFVIDNILVGMMPDGSLQRRELTWAEISSIDWKKSKKKLPDTLHLDGVIDEPDIDESESFDHHPTDLG
jgi:hypothetical protein